MNHIVFLDRATIAPNITVRRPDFDHTWAEHEQTSVDMLVERLRDATIVIDNKVPMRAGTLEKLPNLKMIAMAATGTDCIDKAYCRDQGIVVSNIRGYAQNTVPEFAFALILALRKSIVPFRESVRAGRWQDAGQFCYFDYPLRELAGSTLGIMGEGIIGQRVAEIGRAFGMKVLFAAHKGKSGLGPLYTPWDEVLERSDVITLHCPLTADTEGMIGMAEFRKMTRKPLIVNTARGKLVIEEDLARALDEGLIAGAAFDVTMPEPPAPDNPLIRLLDRPNFILTPHIAWASDEAQQTLADQLIDNIENFVKGAPTNVVSGDF